LVSRLNEKQIPVKNAHGRSIFSLGNLKRAWVEKTEDGKLTLKYQAEITDPRAIDLLKRNSDQNLSVSIGAQSDKIYCKDCDDIISSSEISKHKGHELYVFDVEPLEMSLTKDKAYPEASIDTVQEE